MSIEPIIDIRQSISSPIICKTKKQLRDTRRKRTHYSWDNLDLEEVEAFYIRFQIIYAYRHGPGLYP